ncbi:MAG: polyprenyl synthetase family protein [Polyangiales bacterium]
MDGLAAPHDPFDALRARYLPLVASVTLARAAELLGEASPLAALLRAQLAAGGKRTRAALALAVAVALGADPEAVVPFAAACEVLHDATLVHDDIEDGDRTRRGAESAWARHGLARAINLGDAMMFLAVSLAGTAGAGDAARLRAVRRLTACAMRLAAGQDDDLLARERGAPGDAPTRAAYVATAQGKTGSLLALVLAGAAECCGADEAHVEALERVAAELGVLLQVQDDLVDLYGDKGRGRPGSDLYEGKPSFLVVCACERSPPEERAAMLALLARPRGEKRPGDVAALAGWIDRARAREAAVAQLHATRERALAASPARLRRLVAEAADVILSPARALLADASAG